jgi:hypothetical protein
MKTFKQSLLEGKAWEKSMEEWMKDYLAPKGWSVHDISDVYRDADNDQVPDFTLIQEGTGRYCFIDAKKRKVYNRTFGFGENFYRSYTNIARKHDTKVYVGFYDEVYDDEHVDILDMSQPCDYKKFYNNAYGTENSYRWYADKLVKLKI